ncbi:MAG: energy-coupling factor transporter ATPase [Eubacteriales bacterium]
MKAEHLSFAYPQNPENFVFSDINLQLEQGSFVAILGHNGCGKSTLAKHMNAILLPSGGKLWVGEYLSADLEVLLEIRRRVGMVFQNPDNQIVATVVEEDVAFAPENLGVPTEEIKERVDEALKTVGMEAFRLQAPHLLSGGQKQRVAIAGVLAMKPDCIVMDEPTAMLDPVGRQEVVKTIQSLSRDHGVTVVLITHHMEEAALADRLIVMNKGEIIADDMPEIVFQNVEMLESHGLAVPQTIKLLWELRGEGLPQNGLLEEDCVKILAEFLQNLQKQGTE